MLPTFYLRAVRSGGLPDDVILYLPEYALEVHRVGDVDSHLEMAPLSGPHSPYDIVIFSYPNLDDFLSSKIPEIEKKKDCWSCLWVKPFDIAAMGESARLSAGVSAIACVGIHSSVGPKTTVISSDLEDKILLGYNPRHIWNAVFSASGKYPVKFNTMEFS